jgi:hypothetical protein
VQVPAAYGGARGKRNIFPLSRGVGGNMRVANFEQMIALTGSNGTFNVGGYQINPGLSTQFAWLSSIAANYQVFKIHYMRFVYVPACPTTTSGTTFLYLNYNINTSAPTTLAQVDLSPYSCSGPAWLGSPCDAAVAFSKDLQVSHSIHVDLDVSKLELPRYNVRTGQNATLNTGGALGGTIPAGLTFTAGTIPDFSGRPCTLYYGSNTNTASVIGIIYVAYDIEFSDPVATGLDT